MGACQPPPGGLDAGGIGAARDAEDLMRIALRHVSQCSRELRVAEA
jgi:hypothetical protein